MKSLILIIMFHYWPNLSIEQKTWILKNYSEKTENHILLVMSYNFNFITNVIYEKNDYKQNWKVSI